MRWKVNQHHVLRVLRKQCRSEVKGVQVSSSASRRSLDDNFPGHLRVDRTEVGIFAGLCKGVRKLLVSIDHFGLEYFLRAHDSVRNVVPIDPSNVVPTVTVMAAGPNEKLSIFTSAVEAGFPVRSR